MVVRGRSESHEFQRNPVEEGTFGKAQPSDRSSGPEESSAKSVESLIPFVALREWVLVETSKAHSLKIEQSHVGHFSNLVAIAIDVEAVAAKESAGEVVYEESQKELDGLDQMPVPDWDSSDLDWP